MDLAQHCNSNGLPEAQKEAVKYLQEQAFGIWNLGDICRDSLQVIAVELQVILQPSSNFTKRKEVPQMCLSNCQQFPSQGRRNK